MTMAAGLLKGLNMTIIYIYNRKNLKLLTLKLREKIKDTQNVNICQKVTEYLTILYCNPTSCLRVVIL